MSFVGFPGNFLKIHFQALPDSLPEGGGVEGGVTLQKSNIQEFWGHAAVVNKAGGGGGCCSVLPECSLLPDR